MGLLNGGGAGVLQSVFKNIYQPATIYKNENIYDQWGELQVVETQFECAAQVDEMTEAMRREAGASEQDRRIIVLTNTSAPINTDCEFITTQPGYEGVRWQIASVASDAVFSHWILRGRRAS